jgi:hypothetical protein
VERTKNVHFVHAYLFDNQEVNFNNVRFCSVEKRLKNAFTVSPRLISAKNKDRKMNTVIIGRTLDINLNTTI